MPLAPSLAQGAMRGMPAGAMAFHTGALTAGYLFALAAFAPIWGRLVDRSSRWPVAAGALAGFSASFALLGAAASVPWLYAASVLAGAFAGGVVPAIQAQAAEVQGDELKARVMMRFGAASFAGWFLGPPLASWAGGRAATLGWPAGMLAFGPVVASGVAAALLLLRVRGGRGIAKSGAMSSHARASPRLFLALGMAVTFALGAFEVSLMLWSVEVLRLDQATMSRMLVECTIVMMAAQAVITLAPAARPRWSARGAVVAFVSTGLAIASTPLAANAWLMMAAVAVIAVGATVLQAMISLGTLRSAGTELGSVLGLQVSLSSLAQGAGSLAAGALFSRAGTGFFVPAAVLGAAAVLALREGNASVERSSSR